MVALNCGPQAGNPRITLIQGNAVRLRLSLCANGVPVDNLSAAISGTFQAMGHRNNVVAVQKVLGDLLVDDPAVGTITVPLTSTETAAMLGEYDLAIELTWGPGNSLEWWFTKTLNVIRDQITFDNDC